jgi:hypothetical protein
VADAVHAAFAVEPRGADLEHHRPDHRLHHPSCRQIDQGETWDKEIRYYC